MGAWKEHVLEFIRDDYIVNGEMSRVSSYLAGKSGKSGAELQKTVKNWLDNHGYPVGKRSQTSTTKARAQDIPIDLVEDCVLAGKNNALLRKQLGWSSAGAVERDSIKDVADDLQSLYLALMESQEEVDALMVPIEIDKSTGRALYLFGPGYVQDLGLDELNRMFADYRKQNNLKNMEDVTRPFLATLYLYKVRGFAFEVDNEADDGLIGEKRILLHPLGSYVAHAWQLPMQFDRDEVLKCARGAIKRFRAGDLESLYAYYYLNEPYFPFKGCPPRFSKYFEDPLPF